FDPPATSDAPRSILAAAWDGAWSAVASGVSAVRWMLAPKPRHPAVTAKRPRRTTWDGVTLDTINRYYATVAVTPVRGTSLADIKVTNPDPEVAARVANLHAQTFIDMDVETKIASLSDTQGLLGRQLKEVRQQLEASRRALTDYQLKHGIFNLPKETGTLSRQSLQQLNTLFTKAQGERILAEAAYRNAASLTPSDLAATLPNKGLQTLREQLLSLEGQYQANLKDFGPRHPDMITMRARIAALHSQLNKAAMQARKRLRAVFAAAHTKESALRRDLKKLSRSASQEDRELVQLSIYQRDAESNAQLYANLLDQVKEVNLVGASQWTNVKLVDRAVAPTVPSFPKTKRNLLLGMMLGLIAAGLGCLLIERLDTTINTPDDLVTWLDLPAFGVIPDFRRLSTAPVYGRPALETEEPTGTRHDLVTLLHPASLVSEAYRAVRTNLMFSSPDSPPKSVLITSSQAGEGKTVTVINLAVTLTLSGARVLVVDGDLRNPTCHAALRVKRAPGLSNVLTGQTAVDDVVVRSPLCPVLRNSDNGFGLYVLPAGRVPPNPAELLASQRMTTLLATLKEHFDFVLVDSPPIIPVTDSVVMATKVDGVLMVIRGGEWRRDLVRKALWQLDTVHSHVLGGVLNSVNISRGGHSYYYYQQYHGYRSAYGRPYGQAYGQAPETDDEAAT
ncbi:MAG: GumC family protein, partial [Candidatus Binatia bacterium]